MLTKGIRIEGLKKRYGEGDTAVDALKGVNMRVEPGEVVGLIGPSGSGKTTLLKCLGAVIDPTAGRMRLGDEVIYDDGWKVRDLRALRRDKIRENRLSARQYAALAQTVEDAVGRILAQCKLPPAADEQLHLIVARLLAGAARMAAKDPSASARQGASEVIEALNDYGRYFDDPGYKPLTR